MKAVLFNKIAKFLVLLFAMTFVLKAKVFADDSSAENATNDYITPFGGIAWSDTPLQVLEKMRKIEGVTNIYILVNESNSHEINLLGVHDPKSLVTALRDARGLSVDVATYIDPTGRQRKYPDPTSWLEPAFVASPITIAGMSFNLQVQFAVSAGLALKSPQNVLTDSESGYDLPLVVDTVGLSAAYRAPYPHNDPGISSLPPKFKKLCDILVAKYSRFDKDGDPNTLFKNLNNNGTATATDNEGATFTASFNPAPGFFANGVTVAALPAYLNQFTCDLDYQNKPYIAALNDLYTKFYESHSNPKGPDQSGGL